MAALLAANRNTLVSFDLAAGPTPPAYLDPDVLDTLKHLSLSDAWFTQETLETVFEHARSLTSLVIQGKPVRTFAPAVVFKARPRSFGELDRMSLRINDRYSIDLGLFAAVGEFLRGREGLKMLALQDCASASRIPSALQIVAPTLKGLRALKLGVKNVVSRDLRCMAAMLPESLEALCITGNGMDINAVSILLWLPLILINNRNLGGLFANIPSPTSSSSLLSS